ncbi:MAG: tRNA (cytidine(34)-2'-O)-methyltransferase [Phycisphaerales bacterium]
MPNPLFHIVLHEPEIPNNTGNIGRTCIATGCALHLVRPLGFDTSEKAVRRAGLDYWPRLGVIEHENWGAYLGSTCHDADPLWGQRRAERVGEHDSAEGRRVVARRTTVVRQWFLTTKASRTIWDADLRPGDHLVFGKETRGLPVDILQEHSDRLLVLPMVADERSLNLATAVCSVIYEGLRQCVARGDIRLDDAGRIVAS